MEAVEEKTDYQRLEGMLYGYREKKAKKESLEIERDTLLDDISLTSIDTEEFRPSPTMKISDPTGDQIIRAEEVETYLNHLIKIKKREIDKIEAGLMALTPEEREIIKLRYENREEWEDIASSKYISSKTAMRRHEKAMEKLIDCIFVSLELVKGQVVRE